MLDRSDGADTLSCEGASGLPDVFDIGVGCFRDCDFAGAQRTMASQNQNVII